MLRNFMSGAQSPTRRTPYRLFGTRLDINHRWLVGVAGALIAAGVMLAGPSMLSAQDENGAALALDKAYVGFEDVDDDGELGAGDVITYAFTLTNTGETLLDPVSLEDELLGLDGVTCGVAALEPAESTSCEHTYILTQADVSAGELVNQATATGIDPDENAVSAQAEAIITGLIGPGDDDAVTAEDDEIVELLQAPAIALDKANTGFIDEDDSGELSAGDVLSYTFMITNTGNVTLNTVMLDDETLELEGATCEESELAPAEALSCVFTYTVTEDDMAAGEIYNQAVATGVAPNGVTVTATADVTVELPQNPAIALDKAFTGFIDEDDDGELSVGDIITYTFTITNTGDVSLEPVTLDDEMLGLEGETCGQAALTPGESTTCDHPYTITQADMDAGEVYNLAVVTGGIPTP